MARHFCQNHLSNALLCPHHFLLQILQRQYFFAYEIQIIHIHFQTAFLCTYISMRSLIYPLLHTDLCCLVYKKSTFMLTLSKHGFYMFLFFSLKYFFNFYASWMFTLKKEEMTLTFITYYTQNAKKADLAHFIF